MTSMSTIQDFLDQKSLAIIGASRSGKKFGNLVLRSLLANGYRVFTIHPSAATIEGLPCYRSLTALPESVTGAVIAVPPTETERILPDIVHAGIRRVWMLQGSSSRAAIAVCEKHGIQPIHSLCILMFLPQSAAIHRFHHWIWRIFHRDSVSPGV